MKLLRKLNITRRLIHSGTVLGLLLGGLFLSTLGMLSANATPYVSTDRYWSTDGGWQTNWSGRWEWSSQTGDVSICSLKYCFMEICNMRLGSLTPINARCDSKFKIKIPRGTTATQAQQAWASQYGTSGTWQFGPHIQSGFVSSCAGIALWNLQGGLGVMNGILFPGSSCGKVPPLNLACTTSGKVTIDYGTLSSGQLNGATASTTLSFTCNQAATATIKLNDSVIDLGRKGDLTAAISIGGKDLATGSDVAVKSGTVTTTITSTLKAKGTPAAGAFEGSGVLIISYQ